jgi:hypothetical protein
MSREATSAGAAFFEQHCHLGFGSCNHEAWRTAHRPDAAPTRRRGTALADDEPVSIERSLAATAFDGFGRAPSACRGVAKLLEPAGGGIAQGEQRSVLRQSQQPRRIGEGNGVSRGVEKPGSKTLGQVRDHGAQPRTLLGRDRRGGGVLVGGT